MKPPITLIGAGLVGSLLATLLAQRGFATTVFERRPDPRRAGFIGGRSINLALAERGWHGLRVAGLQKAMQPIAVMMRGRMVHDVDGQTNLQLYGRDDSEVIWSVNRGTLNTTLLDAAETAGARIIFDHRLDHVDWDTSMLHLYGGNGEKRSQHAPILIGADGAGSALRAAMATEVDLGERFEPLGHAYKELEIPPNLPVTAGSRDAGRYAMEPNALHIWPRGGYMCIALPNADGSFTVTLFLPNEGEPSFLSLRDDDAIGAFFDREFSDLASLVPDLVSDFKTNPTGLLGTLYLDRWHLDHRALLLGDAAHAIVPFHGQGMNAGFEDAVELADLIEATPHDCASVFAEFQHRRKSNADAIATMALDNYIEMRDRVDDAEYLQMRDLDRQLAERHPGRWVPRYWMVTFSRVPYAVALQRGAIQDALLREFIASGTQGSTLDPAQWDTRIRAELPPLE
ncbi:MAG: NAD(P)/FAD-dependent oxidoreductase [Dokdonella sp.]